MEPENEDGGTPRLTKAAQLVQRLAEHPMDDNIYIEGEGVLHAGLGVYRYLDE